MKGFTYQYPPEVKNTILLRETTTKEKDSKRENIIIPLCKSVIHWQLERCEQFQFPGLGKRLTERWRAERRAVEMHMEWGPREEQPGQRGVLGLGKQRWVAVYRTEWCGLLGRDKLLTLLKGQKPQVLVLGSKQRNKRFMGDMWNSSSKEVMHVEYLYGSGTSPWKINPPRITNA